MVAPVAITRLRRRRQGRFRPGVAACISASRLRGRGFFKALYQSKVLLNFGKLLFWQGNIYFSWRLIKASSAQRILPSELKSFVENSGITGSADLTTPGQKLSSRDGIVASAELDLALTPAESASQTMKWKLCACRCAAEKFASVMVSLASSVITVFAPED
jgi:hypothetical protein